MRPQEEQVDGRCRRTDYCEYGQYPEFLPSLSHASCPKHQKYTYDDEPVTDCLCFLSSRHLLFPASYRFIFPKKEANISSGLTGPSGFPGPGFLPRLVSIPLPGRKPKNCSNRLISDSGAPVCPTFGSCLPLRPMAAPPAVRKASPDISPRNLT